MVDVIEKYGKVMNSIINSCYYRTLSFNSIHVPLGNILEYVKAESEYGWRGGTLQPLFEPYFWQWNNLKIGEDLYFNMRFFGLPNRINVVFWRPKWYTAYMVRGMLEDILKLPRGTFEIRH